MGVVISSFHTFFGVRCFGFERVVGMLILIITVLYQAKLPLSSYTFPPFSFLNFFVFFLLETWTAC